MLSIFYYYEFTQNVMHEEHQKMNVHYF